MIKKRVHFGYMATPRKDERPVVIATCGIFREGRLLTKDKRKVTCAICLGTTKRRGRKKSATPTPRVPSSTLLRELIDAHARLQTVVAAHGAELPDDVLRALSDLRWALHGICRH